MYNCRPYSLIFKAWFDRWFNRISKTENGSLLSIVLIKRSYVHWNDCKHFKRSIWNFELILLVSSNMMILSKKKSLRKIMIFWPTKMCEFDHPLYFSLISTADWLRIYGAVRCIVAHSFILLSSPLVQRPNGPSSMRESKFAELVDLRLMSWQVCWKYGILWLVVLS